MYVPHVVASGFLLALLALGLEALPAPPSLQKGPPGRVAALGRELAELLAAASGPAAGSARGGGGKQGSGGSSSSQQQQQQQRAKGASSSSSSSSRLMRDLRTDSKHARAGWARGLSPEHHAGGGGGGGGSRRFKGLSKKGLAKGCFGLKLDRIGSMSGLGC